MAKPLAAILKQYSDVIAGKLPASEISKLTLGKEPGVDYAPKMADEREFVASHSVEKFPDRVGNKSDVYNASNIKQTSDPRHGYVPDPKSKNMYKQTNEEFEELDEDEELDEITKTLAKNYLRGIDSEDKNYSSSRKFRNRIMGGAIADAKIKGRSGSKRKTNIKVKATEEYSLSEKKDDREYDYEGEMAISQLKSIMNHANQLISMLEPDTNLPEWVQSKITLGKDYIQTAADYMATEMQEEADLEEGAGSRYYANPTDTAVSNMMNKYVQLRQIAHKTDKNEKKKKVVEEAKCNMSEAGSICEVHGKKACPSEEKSVSDEQPMYNGKKKKGRQLIVDKQISERQMTSAEKKKEEKLKDKYDDSDMKSSMMKQYGAEKGKQVYFAYIRKKAMKNEQAAPADTHIQTPSTLVGDTGRV